MTNVLTRMVDVKVMLKSPTALPGMGMKVRNIESTTSVVVMMIWLEFVRLRCMVLWPLVAVR